METLESRLPSVFIVPLVQFFVAICLFIALLHGQQGLTVLCLLVLGITIGARLWSRLSFARIRCSSSVDKYRLFPDEILSLHVYAENSKLLPVWLEISVPVKGALDPYPGNTRLADECGLLWYQRAGFNWGLVARRRGVHQLGPLNMRVGDLLGFFPGHKKVEDDIQILVYPRLVPLKAFNLPRRDFFGTPGAKSPVEDPIYILGTRDYQHWRPARHIHWKASARHNRLQEKVFEPSEQGKVLLAVEVSRFESSKASESFEQALEVVASLAFQSHQRGYAVGLATNGIVEGGPHILSVGRGSKQLLSILEILARLKMKAVGGLQDILYRAMELQWGISCVHFSYEHYQGILETAQYLGQKRIPTVYVRCSSSEIGESEKYNLESKIFQMNEIRIKEPNKT